MELSRLSTADDCSLIEEAVAGSALAFEALVDRHRAAIVHLAVPVTGNSDDAHDVARETFPRAFLRIADDGMNVRFAPWLATVAQNAVVDSIRRKRVREPGSAVANGGGRDAGPEDFAIRNDTSAELRRALVGLPHRYKAALDLYDFRGLSYREIGDTLGLPIGMLKTDLFRALRMMHDQQRVRDLRMIA